MRETGLLQLSIVVVLLFQLTLSAPIYCPAELRGQLSLCKAGQYTKYFYGFVVPNPPDVPEGHHIIKLGTTSRPSFFELRYKAEFGTLISKYLPTSAKGAALIETFEPFVSAPNNVPSDVEEAVRLSISKHIQFRVQIECRVSGRCLDAHLACELPHLRAKDSTGPDIEDGLYNIKRLPVFPNTEIANRGFWHNYMLGHVDWLSSGGDTEFYLYQGRLDRLADLFDEIFIERTYVKF